MARYQNGSVRIEPEIGWSNVGFIAFSKRDLMGRESKTQDSTWSVRDSGPSEKDAWRKWIDNVLGQMLKSTIPLPLLARRWVAR